MSMGRKLASGDLQLLVLALLADKPRHGYEIIKALEERSKGFYTPSPGMVYPALTYLEEIGYATVAADGARKLYHITASGRRSLMKTAVSSIRCSRSSSALAKRWNGCGVRSLQTRMHQTPRTWAQDAAAPKKCCTHGANSKAHKHGGRNSAEQERIAEILRRAAAEIRSKPASGS